MSVEVTYYYARPYSPEHVGFRFWDKDSYAKGRRKLAKSGCEEFEIEFLSGPESAKRAFLDIEPTQDEMELYMEICADPESDQVYAIRYLVHIIGYDLATAIAESGRVKLWRGSATEYAEHMYVDVIFYVIPNSLIRYVDIDYDALGRDMEQEGDIYEVDYRVYVVNVRWI